MGDKSGYGNRVWHDLNRNGVQDPGEPGVAGVTVKLYKADGTLFGTKVTDANGLYLFANIPAGDYYAVFSGLPAGMAATVADAGGNDLIDSDPNAATLTTIVTTLTFGEVDTTWDLGLVMVTTTSSEPTTSSKPTTTSEPTTTTTSPTTTTTVPSASIGDYVWEDLDFDGIQDAGEPGIPGVKVELLGGTNGTTVIATTTTGAAGQYLFSGLNAGTYTVRFTMPSDYGLTLANQGTNDSVDSDATADSASGSPATTATTGAVTVTNGANLTVDAGMTRPVDLIVDKSLASGSTTATGQTITYPIAVSNAGPGAEPGPITLTDTLPAGLTPVSATGDGWDCSISGQVISCTRTAGLAKGASAPTITTTATITATGGELINTAVVSGRAVDVKLSNNTDTVTITVGKASIGDFVFDDLDGDGVQDTGEPGVSGVTVELLNSSGTVIRTTTTDSDGKYLFDGLVAGTYSVRFTAPSGTAFTTANAGSNDATDSDASSTGTTSTITLGAGESNTTIDAGLRRDVDLAIDKQQKGTFAAGETVTYTLDVTNNGPGAEVGPIKVTDTLPSGLEFVSASGTGWTCSQSSGVITCTRPGPLAKGAAAPTITITAKVGANASSSLTNQASVTGTSRDTNLTNNTDSVSADVAKPGKVDLAITKSGVASALTLGATVTYTLGVSNAGAVAETGPITVVDQLPAAVSFVSAGGDGWTCNSSGTVGAVVTCKAAGPLAAGARLANITISTTVVATGDIVNVASVSGAKPITEEIRTDNNTAKFTLAVPSVVVEAPVAKPIVKTPAITGASIARGAFLGLTLVTFGLLLVVALRRRRDTGSVIR